MKRKQIEILILLIFSFILISYAYFTPLLGEDEGNYIGIAKEITKTGMYPQTDFLGEPKRLLPLFPFILSPFSDSLPLSKIVVAIFGVLTMFMTYLFCEKYIKKGSGIIGASLLFSIPFFVHFSMIDYVEVPIAFFSITSLYFFLKAKNLKDSILPGIFMGLGLLTKESALLIPILFFLYSIYKKEIKIWFLSTLIAILILSPWILRNIILFNYPFYSIFNIPFRVEEIVEVAGERAREVVKAAQVSIPPMRVIENLGLLVSFLSIMGFFYSYYEKKEIGLLCVLFFIIFIIFWFSPLIGIKDVRYFSIMFPQLSILGTIGLSSFLDTIKNRKILLAIIIGIIFLSLYFGFNMAVGTSSNVRYREGYLKALEWIKKNTDEDIGFMTVFCGSGDFYSERNCVWPVRDLPELMTTNSDEEILDILEDYKTKYILIQAGITSQSYIAPGTMTIGVFSLQFVDTISKSDKFELVYSSDNNVIYAPGLVLPEVMIYEVL